MLFADLVLRHCAMVHSPDSHHSLAPHDKRYTIHSDPEGEPDTNLAVGNRQGSMLPGIATDSEVESGEIVERPEAATGESLAPTEGCDALCEHQGDGVTTERGSKEKEDGGGLVQANENAVESGSGKEPLLSQDPNIDSLSPVNEPGLSESSLDCAPQKDSTEVAQKRGGNHKKEHSHHRSHRASKKRSRDGFLEESKQRATRHRRHRSRSRCRDADRGRSLSANGLRRRTLRRHPSKSRSRDRAGRDREHRRRSRSADREMPRKERDRRRSRKRSRSRSLSHDRSLRVRRKSRERSRDRRSRDRCQDRRSRHRRRSPEEADRHRRRRRRSGDGRSKRRRSAQRKRRDSDTEVEDEEYEARVVAALERTEEDEDRLIEERRRRRQEILNKHRQQQLPQEEPQRDATAMQLSNTPQVADFPSEERMLGALSEDNSNSFGPATPPPDALPLLPELGIVAPEAPVDQSLEASQDKSSGEAADTTQIVENPGTGSDAGASEDIFCDAPVDRAGPTLDEAVRKAAAQKGLADAYDDPEGYYQFQFGEIVGQRYEVFASKGKGVFSTVIRAWDKSRRNAEGKHPEVAIKILRSNDVMKKSGKTEEQILKKLSNTDPDNKHHCIRLISSFEYRGHLCLVCEPLEMNLRELVAKFGRNVGLNINAVGHYTAQLLDALRHLKNNQILHADIKPDNILVNDKFSKVKICDFGSAMSHGEVEETPYLVSRFYRAPEVILGLRYDYAMDLWAVGCVIFEVFTGKILFPGKTNNEMLKLMMEVKGAFPKKKLKKGKFCSEHFENDPNMSFAQMDEDPVTKKPIKRLIVNPTVKRDFKSMLLKSCGDSDRELVLLLADLLEKMMVLDPEQRIDLEKARRHPFLRKILQKSSAGRGNKKEVVN